MIRAVIFDLGGVLIDNPSKMMFDHYSKTLNVTNEAFLKAFLEHREEWQTGQISEEQFWKNVSETLKVPPPKNTQLWIEGYVKAYKEKPEVFELIETLRNDKGMKIGLLSNTELPIASYIKEKKFKNFDEIVFSCEIKFEKPEKEAYEAILNSMNIQPKEALFIDDRIENIIGATDIGAFGIKFETAKNLREELANYALI